MTVAWNLFFRHGWENVFDAVQDLGYNDRKNVMFKYPSKIRKGTELKTYDVGLCGSTLLFVLHM